MSAAPFETKVRPGRSPAKQTNAKRHPRKGYYEDREILQGIGRFGLGHVRQATLDRRSYAVT